MMSGMFLLRLLFVANTRQFSTFASTVRRKHQTVFYFCVYCSSQTPDSFLLLRLLFVANTRQFSTFASTVRRKHQTVFYFCVYCSSQTPDSFPGSNLPVSQAKYHLMMSGMFLLRLLFVANTRQFSTFASTVRRKHQTVFYFCVYCSSQTPDSFLLFLVAIFQFLKQNTTHLSFQDYSKLHQVSVFDFFVSL